MSLEVKVPTLGESITSGILASWHVSDGDTVKTGDVLYELETDKITTEGSAEASGVIHLKAQEGDEVEVGQVVAEIEEGASGDSGEEEKASDKKEETKASDSEDDSGEGEGGESDEDEAPAKGEGHPAVSPAVKRVADETGIDPATVEGTGKDGRVTKADMMRAAREQDEKERSPEQKKLQEEGATPAPKADAPADKKEPQQKPEAAPDPSERTTRRKMTPLRKRVAERLVQAQQQAAILTTFNECDMSAVMGLRKKHQESFVDKHGIKLGFMSFFVKACVYALQSVPNINAQIEGDEIIENHYYDIGVAVSTPRGLMVPVLRDPDQKSFADVEKDIINYATKARDGKIGIEDLQGGVFTITNGGIFGSMLSTPILNQPQSGILGMHTIQERPVARNGEVVIRPMMYLALSYDHRIVDGREAVTFLVKVKEAIEDPVRLLFDL